MDISESRIRAIVERVVERVAQEQGLSGAAGSPTRSGGSSPELGCFDDLDDAVKAARVAYRELQDVTIGHREKIIASIRKVMDQNNRMLAEMAVRETKFGRVDDKVIKNNLAIWKTPGTEDLQTRALSGDHGLTIWERSPFGVIGSITPCTNPTPTIVSNGIGFIAAGNSGVFCPHPLAKETSVLCVRLINEAVVAAGGPVNLIVTLRAPSIKQAQALMTHEGINLLVVTGGPEVVKAAMSSGKRVIGAGPGTPPALVVETADLQKAAYDLVRGASFDNNIICTDEKEVFAVASIHEELKRLMLQQPAVEVKGQALKRLEQLVLKENRGPRRHAVVNKEWVGKDATAILEAIGVDCPRDTRLVICDVEQDHPFVWSELLMPVLAMAKVRDWQEGVAISVEAEHGFRHTSSMHSTHIARLSVMARAMDTSIFVKNGPNFAGLGEGGEGHASFTIASPTGDGVTSARNFTRERKCIVVDQLRIV
ncbi:MAG: aldehyde dehydrogenase EutE [Candidatus Sericytochromatia bacterium]|nr:aldehyde dehydrogenase EutE [Candidatus Sericytochromatia bacterium]